jgi:hypothetical protein
MTRDHNGERGAIPGPYRAHDWQTCRVLRIGGDAWRRRRTSRNLRLARVPLSHLGAHTIRREL